MIRTDRMLAILAAAAFVAAAFVPATAAQQARTQCAAVTETFTIVAIDQTNRDITLKDKGGYRDAMYAGAEVQRVNELKVGDTVTFRYYESVVYQIHKAGTTPPPSGGNAAVTRNAGPKPGGTISRQMTATVTVQ